jgi:hypothetical protein
MDALYLNTYLCVYVHSCFAQNSLIPVLMTSPTKYENYKKWCNIY